MKPNIEAVETFADTIKNRLGYLAAEVEAIVNPAPDRTILVAPGSSVAWDENCDGQVWARLVSLTPLQTNNPSQRPGMNPCAVPEFVVTFELGIVRCAAVVNDAGVAPSDVQITEDGVQSINDMSHILSVLRCTNFLRSITAWTPQGPEGGYHGGYWTGTFLVHNCLRCDEE